MKKLILLIFTILTTFTFFGQQINSTAIREIIQSNILEDGREISIYLPPSYYSSKQTYPVLYILDGDYNFFYVSGLLELQSAISENIPEMILIGISGKGSETYKKNCKPNLENIDDEGNADQYANFIEKELIPFVNEKYRTSDYKLLAGHSVGGLFIINTVLKKPNLFNHYIAISPALWWANNAINEVAKNTFNSKPNFSSDVYISLANEKGMGVDEFLDVVKKNNIYKSVFKFKHFQNENHNSVGAPTYVWALNDIFSTWKGDKEYFKKTKELTEYHKSVVDKYGTIFNMQTSLLGYTIYILQDEDDELKKFQLEIKKLFPEAGAKFDNLLAGRKLKQDKQTEAEKILNQSLQEYPSFFNHYNALAKINLENKKYEVAKKLINKGIVLATEQKARRWQINELIETQEKIKEVYNGYK